jgi:hypothetical protein
MTTWTGNLKPRAVAALCSLRNGGRSSISLRNAIGDPTIPATRDLMGDLRDMKLVQRSTSECWILTHEGIGWLQTHGLDVNQEAKREASEAFNRFSRSS